MVKVRFEYIIRKLKYTMIDSPTYQDRFHCIYEVQVQDELNRNMTQIFIASYLVYLDESIPKWLRQLSCSGFFSVKQNLAIWK